MLVSRALAHGVVDTGREGGANALLIILGVGILIFLLYMARNKWRRRNASPDDNDELPDA